MASDIYSMLTGGYDPYAESMKQEQAFQQRLSSATDPRSFIATVGSNLGGQLGRGAGRLFGGASPEEEKTKLKQEALAEVQASGIDMSDQVAVLKGIMQALQKRGLTAEAMAVGSQMPKTDKVTTSTLAKLMSEQKAFEPGSPQFIAYQKAIEKETASAEKATPTSKLAKLIAEQKNYEPGTPNYELYRKAINEETSKTSPVTLEFPGQEKPIDIPKFRSDLTGTVKPYLNAVDAADTVITAMNLGLTENNFAAAKGAATALVKAFGDGQVSRLEALNAGADPSIIGGGIDYLNQLFTGTPSKDTMTKVLKTAEALKKLNKKKLNTELGVQKRLAVRAKIPQEVIDDLFSGYQQERTVTRTGTLNGRKVVEYDDGSVEYAD